MGKDQVKELKRLQKENDHQRRVISDRTLEKLILREAARRNFKASRVVVSALIISVARWRYPNAGFAVCLARIDPLSGGVHGADWTKGVWWRI